MMSIVGVGGRGTPKAGWKADELSECDIDKGEGGTVIKEMLPTSYVSGPLLPLRLLLRPRLRAVFHIDFFFRHS